MTIRLNQLWILTLLFLPVGCTGTDQRIINDFKENGQIYTELKKALTLDPAFRNKLDKHVSSHALISDTLYNHINIMEKN